MTHRPELAVIIATNRMSPFLDAAVSSALAQTLPPSEILVVDDGGPDPDALDAALAAHPSVRVLHLPAGGVGAARNAGAAATGGEWIAFLDDDDRWHPERLERQFASLAGHPGAVVGYCGLRSIDENDRVVAEPDQVQVADRLDIARRTTGILLPNALVRRSAFEEIGGFDPGLRLAEDLDLVLRLAETGGFVFTDGALVDYRTHPGNTTGSYRPLAAAIRDVVERHRREAVAAGDGALASAHLESRRANGRFAWWAALRAAKASAAAGRRGEAAGAVAWAVRFAPTAPFDAVGRRLRRRR
ncbi:glycosyltransferase family A protein [Agromyces seonyuensis]|uniref:Glycosyltransferase n=1 Tax=Agromyces seonyuensis TaxID=2662446 RepID=A0A6I4NS69_9MICO|nr:glycosyltransferase family A protein [Agromyces seonyuensis]MWB97276.1 glycosyltransferase [Agromyces seonyuensis]